MQVPGVGLGVAGKQCWDEHEELLPADRRLKALYFSKFRGKGHKQEEPASDDEE